jgi:hypothetical protein
MDRDRFGDWDINSLEIVSKEESDAARKKAYDKAALLSSFNGNDELTFYDKHEWGNDFLDDMLLYYLSRPPFLEYTKLNTET